MKTFLSCDWGTSSFRLRLVDAERMEVLATESADKGIAATFDSWRNSGNKGQQNRVYFYIEIIREHIQKIETTQNISLRGVPLIISGMASGSIGMENLPYQELPFKTDGSDAGVKFYKKSGNFEHPVLLISGLKSEDDVMRGEETELTGSVAGLHDLAGEKIFIFPGTHSKHILVNDHQVVSFKTYMTGEFFELLSKKSILSAGVEKHQDMENETSLKSFQQGVLDATESNILHTAFLVRTNQLFGKLGKRENFSYLSGLLIGTELQGLLPLSTAHIYMCGNSSLKFLYEKAFCVLGKEHLLHALPEKRTEEAVIWGQFEIYKHFNYKK